MSDERRASLDRQRHALAVKVVFAYETSFWEEQGQNGDAYWETGVIGGTWVQREGIISALVPPERLAAFLATSPALVEGEMIDEMAQAFGERARSPLAVFFRRWGVDPWTEGYITSWRPGDVMARRAASRHPRASLLRLRLGPVGVRLHGGSRAHGPGRRTGGARRNLDKRSVAESRFRV